MGTHEAEGAKPGGFGPAKKYERHGSAQHKSGWQERDSAEQAETAEGSHRAPLGPEGSIPRSTLAERLYKRVADRKEG